MRRMVSEEAQKALKQIKASSTGIEVKTIDSVKSIDSQEFPNGVEGVKIEPGEVSIYENDDNNDPTYIKMSLPQDGHTYWPEISMMADGGVGHTIGYKHETDEVAIDDEPIATVSLDTTDASGMTIETDVGGDWTVEHVHICRVGPLQFIHMAIKAETAPSKTGWVTIKLPDSLKKKMKATENRHQISCCGWYTGAASGISDAILELNRDITVYCTQNVPILIECELFY